MHYTLALSCQSDNQVADCRDDLCLLEDRFDRESPIKETGNLYWGIKETSLMLGEEL